MSSVKCEPAQSPREIEPALQTPHHHDYHHDLTDTLDTASIYRSDDIARWPLSPGDSSCSPEPASMKPTFSFVKAEKKTTATAIYKTIATPFPPLPTSPVIAEDGTSFAAARQESREMTPGPTITTPAIVSTSSLLASRLLTSLSDPVPLCAGGCHEEVWKRLSLLTEVVHLIHGEQGKARQEFEKTRQQQLEATRQFLAIIAGQQITIGNLQEELCSIKRSLGRVDEYSQSSRRKINRIMAQLEWMPNIQGEKTRDICGDRRRDTVVTSAASAPPASTTSIASKPPIEGSTPAPSPATTAPTAITQSYASAMTAQSTPTPLSPPTSSGLQSQPHSSAKAPTPTSLRPPEATPSVGCHQSIPPCPASTPTPTSGTTCASTIGSTPALVNSLVPPPPTSPPPPHFSLKRPAEEQDVRTTDEQRRQQQQHDQPRRQNSTSSSGNTPRPDPKRTKSSSCSSSLSQNPTTKRKEDNGEKKWGKDEMAKKGKKKKKEEKCFVADIRCPTIPTAVASTSSHTKEDVDDSDSDMRLWIQQEQRRKEKYSKKAATTTTPQRSPLPISQSSSTVTTDVTLSTALSSTRSILGNSSSSSSTSSIIVTSNAAASSSSPPPSVSPPSSVGDPHSLSDHSQLPLKFPAAMQRGLQVARRGTKYKTRLTRVHFKGRD